MNFTKKQVDLINLNLNWSFIAAHFNDPYDAIDAFSDVSYSEGNMDDFRKKKKAYEEKYGETLRIDNNYSMTWGPYAYGMFQIFEDAIG